MRAYWKPGDAFFELLRDKAAIDTMFRHVGDKRVADTNVTATTKAQKKIVRDLLTGNGRQQFEDWFPHYMAFPFKTYTKRGGGRLSENKARVKLLIA